MASAGLKLCRLVVLGGAGRCHVRHGSRPTGARILTAVDFKNNRYNLFVVAISGSASG